MGPAAILNIIITANSAQANAALARTQTQMKATAALAETQAMKTAASWDAAGNRMRKIGKTLTTHVSLPAAAAGAAAVKMSLDFHTAMELVHTQAGASSAEVRNLTKSVLEFAKSGKTQYGPKQLAEALYAIESAGIRGGKAMETLKASSDLAMIGQADLATTTKALAAAQKTGIRGAQNLHAAIGTLNAVVGQGQMHMDDLVSAMGTGFLAAARQMGLRLDETGAALAELTKQGIGATQGATRLRMAFTLMAAPTDKAKEALAGVGLGADELATTMRTKGLVPALQMLKDHMEGMSKVARTQFLAQAFGGARTATAIMMLVNNVGDLDTVLQGVRRHADDVGQSIADIKKDPAVQLKIAWAQLQATLIELGDVLVPAVTKVAKAFAGLIGLFPPGGLAVLIGAAAVIGPLATMVGWVMKLAAAWRAVVVAQAGADIAAGAGAGAGAAGTAAGGTFAAKFILAATAALLAYDLAKVLKQAIEGHPLQAPVSEQITTQLNQALGAAAKSVTIGAAGVTLRTALGKLVFNPETGKVISASTKKLKDLIGMGVDQAITKLREKLGGGATKGAAADWGRALDVLNQLAKTKFAKTLNITQTSVDSMRNAVAHGMNWRDAVKNNFDSWIAQIQRGMDRGKINVTRGMVAINRLLSAEAKALGVPNWNIDIAGAMAGAQHIGENWKQAGGVIVPGRGTGDRVPAMLEPGEVVVNRRAVAAMGGAQKVNRINKAIPRFAGGGVVNWPSSTAPGVVDDIGYGALNLASKWGKKWIADMKKKFAAAGAAGAGKMRHYPHLSGDTDFAVALGQALSRMAKAAGTNISVTSGYRSRAEQAGLYAANPNPMMVAPPGRSHHQLGIAADISPDRSVFGGMAGKFGLRFPMSWEPWHIELAKYARGGVVKGKVSTFGPPLEAAGRTASGVSSSQPGIAIYDHSTLGKLFKMVIGTHKAALTQTDFGPAPWTGRKLDVTGAGARKMGIDPRRFPTDAMGKAWRISGKTKAPKKVSTTKVKGGSTTTPPWSISLPAGLADTMRILGEDVNRFGDFSSRAAEWGPLGGLDEIGWLTNQLGALQQLREIVLQAVRWLQMVIQRYQEAIDKAQKEIRKFRKDKKRVKGLEAQIQKWETRRDITKGVLNGEEGPLAKLSELQDPLINPSLAFRSLNLFDPALGGMFGGTIGEVQSALRAAGEKVKTAGYGTHALPINLSQFFPGFAMGGIVPGTGEQLILAHGGELIVPKGMQAGGVVGGQAGADVLAAVGPFGTGSQLEQLGAAGALAELTSGILDDIAVYINLVAYWTQELARLQSIGAPATEIQSAAGALASAQQALSGLQADAVLGPLEAAVALAQLTATLGDDVTAQAALVKYWTDKLASLIASGATPAEIAAAAGSLASAQQTLDQLNADLILGPLEMAVALAGLTAGLGDDVAAQAALVKYYTDQLAKLIAEGATPAEISAAANALAGAKSALKDLEIKKALEPIEMAAALAKLTEGMDDDIAAATDLVAFWSDTLKNLQAAGGSMADITEAANNLASAQEALKALEGQTKQEGPDFQALLDLTKQRLSEAQKQLIVSQAQHPVFAGFFQKGGRIPTGQWGIAGERGPEIVFGPGQVAPLGGTRVEIHFDNGMEWLRDFVTVTVDGREQGQISQARRSIGAR